jgi:hypothetical protein
MLKIFSGSVGIGGEPPPDFAHAPRYRRFGNAEDLGDTALVAARTLQRLANEILLDVYVRVVSFEPHMKDSEQRLFRAYAKEVARIDQNGDGIITAVEADLEDQSDGGQSNDRLFLPATQFDRFAVTREINDGLLAPRFAPSQRAWVLSGSLASVSPAVAASIPQDADNR